MPFVGPLCTPCATATVCGSEYAVCPECRDLMSLHDAHGGDEPTWYACRLCSCATRAKGHTWPLVRLEAS
jgi:hypothetical protein